jgi:hypothetical protein
MHPTYRFEVPGVVIDNGDKVGDLAGPIYRHEILQTQVTLFLQAVSGQMLRAISQDVIAPLW